MGDLHLGLFEVPEFGGRFMPPLRPRLNRTGAVWRLGDLGGTGSGAAGDSAASSAERAQVARFMRVINGAPEVMVKVTGVNRDAGALNAHFKYLARTSADAEIEDENRSGFLGESGEMRRLAREWGVAEAENETGEEGRRRPVAAVHIVLSMPKGTNPQSVLDAARGFADEELSNHRYLLALHQNKQHPHVHVVVNNVGYDLKPLSRNRDDLMRWRESFARELRARGIEAEATLRKTRGVIQKPYNRKVRLAAQTSKEKHGDFRNARVYQFKVRDAANALRGIGRDQAHVAEVRARENRELAERIMKDAIEKLGQQGEEGRAVAANVARFLSTMPPPETELEVFQREISREPALAEVRNPPESQRVAQRGG